jgi:hypothetical protein
VEYTDDLDNEAFPQAADQTSYRRTSPMRNITRQMVLDDPRAGSLRGMETRGAATRTSQQTGAVTVQQEPTNHSGFTVLIEGYSPYQRISELLDPPMVGDDQNRWGVITRFENMDKLFEDVPFELFNKHEIDDFKVETGLVDLMNPAGMPEGIGIEKVMERVPQAQNTPAPGREFTRRNVNMQTNTQDYVPTESVLVDPMTGEEISKTYDIITQADVNANPDLTERDLGRIKWNSYGEQQFIERDRWFRIQAKFIWKDAPAVDITSTGTATTPSSRVNRGGL